MTRFVLVAMAVLCVACGDDGKTKNAKGTDAEMATDVSSAVDMGASQGDAGSTGFVRPSAMVTLLPIQVFDITPHPSGWAIIGTPTEGATVNGTALTGRFAVAVVDAFSQTVWAKSIDPPDRDSDLGSVAVDGDGAVYVGLVSYSRSIDFGDDVSAQGDADGLAQSGFIVKYDATGETQWASSFWADSGLANTFVAARGPYVVAAGTYTIWDPFSYRGPDGIVSGPAFKRGSTRTAFVVALDRETGAGRWHELYSSTSEGATLNDVELLDDGSVLTAGYFDNVDTGTLTNPDGDVYTDAAPGGYVARFGADGGLQWFTVAGERLQVATNGADIVVGGENAEEQSFAATVEPTTGDLQEESLLGASRAVVDLTYDRRITALMAPATDATSTGQIDGVPLPKEGFVVQLEGPQVVWLEAIPSNDAVHVNATSIADDDGKVAVAGDFTGEFDPGDGLLSSTSTDGVFLLLEGG